jgi:hypothetical protein
MPFPSSSTAEFSTHVSGAISISAPLANRYLIMQGFLLASATKIPGNKPRLPALVVDPPRNQYRLRSQ